MQRTPQDLLDSGAERHRFPCFRNARVFPDALGPKLSGVSEAHEGGHDDEQGSHANTLAEPFRWAQWNGWTYFAWLILYRTSTRRP